MSPEVPANSSSILITYRIPAVCRVFNIVVILSVSKDLYFCESEDLERFRACPD
jgi:hypothetical protein